MKVNLVCPGRFLAFEVARELKRQGAMGQLYTGAPVFGDRISLPWYDLEQDDVVSYPWPMGLQVAINRAFRRRSLTVAARRWTNRWFGEWAFGRMRPCEVIHAWAGAGLEVFRRARDWGALRVLGRYSAHRVWNRRLLAEEYVALGCDYFELDSSVRRELEEYERADLIVVNSGFARRTFIAEGVPGQKVISIPQGAPVELGRLHRQKGGPFRVLYVGAQTVGKGVRYFYRTAAELADHPDIEFVIVGPRPERVLEPEFERCRHAFQYLGYRPKKELHREIYPGGTVLVQPSLTEGLSYVVLEALSHGLPVIATPNTGCEEFVTNGREGFTIAPRDWTAIVERVLYLYNNRRALERMRRKARAAAQSAWTWGDFGERQIEVYRKFLRDTG